jgi:hypothetical protein
MTCELFEFNGWHLLLRKAIRTDRGFGFQSKVIVAVDWMWCVTVVLILAASFFSYF